MQFQAAPIPVDPAFGLALLSVRIALRTRPMAIRINRPEIEAPIQQRLVSDAFDSVEDVLFDALEMQRECGPGNR
jgi:hypothetical protein